MYFCNFAALLNFCFCGYFALLTAEYPNSQVVLWHPVLSCLFVSHDAILLLFVQSWLVSKQEFKTLDLPLIAHMSASGLCPGNESPRAEKQNKLQVFA